MRGLPCVLLFILSEVRTSDARPDDDDDEPAELLKKVDVYPEHFAEPVPFGHITLEGVGDPFSKFKQPVDFFELMMRFPKNKEEQKEIVKKGGRDISIINIDLAKSFAGPRDEYLKEMMVNPPPETNATKLKWYDLAEIQMKNAMMPPGGKVLQNPEIRNYERMVPSPPIRDSKHFFDRNSFQLAGNKEDPINWTTCDEFAVGAIFSPKDIVNLKWTPFYVWSTMDYAYSTVHTFEYPTKKVVAEYYSKYNKYLNKTVDWTNLKLLMKGMNEMLLIAVDKRGLFDAIPKHEIPDAAKHTPLILPSLSLRMKIEDPYLVMTYCEDYYATVMAISGKEPTLYKDIKAEVATIKFVGRGRPLWRDHDGDKEKIKLEQEARIQAERDKVIVIDQPMPPVGQWD